MKTKLKLISLVLFIITAIYGFSMPCQAAGNAVGDLSSKNFAIGGSVGGMISPGAFTGSISAGYLMDGIFSIGPYVQGAINSDIRSIMVLLDGRFRTSIPGLSERIKFNALVGAGYIHKRNPFGNDNDFTAHAGVGGEYFIIENLSAGMDIIANITSSSLDRFFLSILAGVTYYI